MDVELFFFLILHYLSILHYIFQWNLFQFTCISTFGKYYNKEKTDKKKFTG